MRVVGLTGAIGSGKSSVAAKFKALGAEVVDADLLAREVVAPGTPGFAAVVARFGSGILNDGGDIDRRKLGAIVFNDAAARLDLNAIVHPAIADRLRDRLVALESAGAALAIYDVPLFFENHLDTMFPEVIVVDVSPQRQRERIARRDGLAPDEIEARIRSQMPLAEKVRRATWVIDNNGDPNTTEVQVKDLYLKLIEETKAP